MKYRIVKQSGKYYIQYTRPDQWIGPLKWEWLVYSDEDSELSRFVYLSFDAARLAVSEIIGKDDIEVVWTQP